MRRSVQILFVLTAMGALFTAPAKSQHVFQPDDVNLGGFDHDYLYLWKIDLPGGLAAGEVLTRADLTIFNIYNADWQTSNELHIHLLDDDFIDAQFTAGHTQLLTGTDDVYYGLDPLPSGDALAGQGVWLTTYVDTYGTGTYDMIYSFTQSQLDALADYLADGSFGLGFDPDCQFVQSGVTLTLYTDPPVVPVPGGLLLASLGAGLIGWFRSRRSF